MKYRLRLDPNLHREIEEAADYIADHGSPRRAKLWAEGLHEAIQRLIDLPKGYPAARERKQWPRADLRQTGYKSYRILFEVDDDAGEVRVLHIHHTARRNWNPDSL